MSTAIVAPPWHGVDNLLDSYMNVKKGDIAIVLYVDETREPATWVIAALRTRGVDVAPVVTRPFVDDGLRDRLLDALPGPDAVDGRLFLVVMEVQSLSHSQVQREVLRPYDSDVVSMVWIHNASREFFELGVALTPDDLVARNATLLHRLMPARELRVRSRAGTDLRITLNSRYKWGSNRGIAQPGEPLVLPAGEVSTYAGSVNGTLIVDGAVHVNRVVNDEVGGLRDTPIQIEIVESEAREVDCPNPSLLSKVLEWFDRPNARRVGELGFGTNLGVRQFTKWNSRLNERAPAVHLGFGQHDQMPHLVDYWSDVHLDLIMADSTVEIDGGEPFDLRTFENDLVDHPEGLPNEDGAAADAAMPHQV